MATDKDTQTATRDAAARTREAVDDAARGGEASTRRAADAARSIAEDSTRSGEHTVERGAETGRKALDAGAETARATLDSVQDAAGRTTTKLQHALGLTGDAQSKALRQTRESLDVVVQCGGVLANGFQSIWKEWLGLAQEVGARNAEAVNTLMRSRTIPAVYAEQASALKDNLELLLNRSVTVSELSARTANDAIRALTDRAEDAAQNARRQV